MPRNMSFALTTEQFKNRTKTVTRRKGWQFLKPGDEVMGCVKCMGLKKGEKIEKLGLIRIVDVRRELLGVLLTKPGYGYTELIKEGFPYMSILDFMSLFWGQGIEPMHKITRIEFEYV